MATNLIPSAFWFRRLHSFLGFALVIYMMFHLLVNSQAALWIGEDGKGFIDQVNKIHKLPYLLVIELSMIAIPLIIHALFGISYLKSAKSNSYGNYKTSVYLPEYSRNHAYTWQRITSWLLIIGLLIHVIHMRFLEYPEHFIRDNQAYYITRVTEDPGLFKVAKRLQVDLKKTLLPKDYPEITKVIQSGEFYALAKDFGTAELLMLRETFKSYLWMGFYTLFLLSACFHGFNGLWTCLITWGITFTKRSQVIFLKISTFLMFLFTFLGLATIYGTYWINLKI